LQFVCPNIFSLPSDPAKAEECKGKLEIALTTFENSFFVEESLLFVEMIFLWLT